MSTIRNISQGQPATLVDNRIQNQNLSKPAGTLRTLDMGDRIQGKVISVSDDGSSKSVQISLGGDEVLSAKLSEGMSLKEGQFVSFEVRGTGGQVVLTPLFENLGADPTMLKALEAAGLSASDENINMVKTMMENGASIDRDALLSMHGLMNTHPDTDVATLVQMKNLNLPVTPQNIMQFESYKNYEHQVVETMDDIMENLPGAYNELIDSGKATVANDMYGQILNMLSEGAEGMNKEAIISFTDGNVMPANGEVFIDGELSEAVEMLNVPLEENETTAQNVSQNSGGTIVLEEVGDELAALQEDGTEINASGEPKGEMAVAADAEKGAVQSATAGEQNSENAAAVSNRFQLAVTIQPDNDFINVLKSVFDKAGLSGDELSKLVQMGQNSTPSEVDVAKVLKELSESYQNSAHSSAEVDEAFTKLFSSEGFNKLMKDAIKNQWLIKPEDVSSKENIDNLYQRLNTQAKQLTETLTGSLGAENKVAQSASNLQNNLNFMNELNQMFQYIQLPLKMSDQDAHGDLYVYANGKRKFEPGDTVSAILHLDMDNLGPVDVYVKMKDNNVKTNFYVADEEVLDLIEAHIDILNERLEKRGYTMQAKMMLHTDMDEDSEDMPIDEMLGQKKMPLLSVTSFDARA